jgi:hypothetical protein
MSFARVPSGFWLEGVRRGGWFDGRMEQFGKWLVLVGLGVALSGGLLWVSGGRSGSGGGWLPGDLSFEWSGVTVHFPWVTCLVLSVLGTLCLRWIGRS